MTDVTALLDDFARTHLQPLGVRILFAVCLLFIGRWIALGLARGLDRIMERGRVEASLRKFLRDIAYACMLVAVVIIALDAVGIETSSLLAVLGAAGLAVGLALQASLSNFAAGVMLIVLRPYKVTDLVQLGAFVGRVEAIRIFHTVIITADHREISLPNGKVLAGEIQNLTALGRRRIELLVTFEELTDLARARELASDALAGIPEILAAPAPEIAIAKVGNSSISLFVRPWSNAETQNLAMTRAMESLHGHLSTAGVKFAMAPVAPS